MSFDGDLEHLPIVDVIQLLHATRKSGTLTLRSLKGESQLVFHDGFIVSANHVNNSVRIGQILMDMGKLTEAELDQALREQHQIPGTQRKPLIQALIESGRVETQAAYQGLETLIEMTIVEVLTWTKGTFSLDVNRFFVSDEYRYFPEQLKQEIHLDTQNVLMDALRIYDERMRDGTLSVEAMFGAPRELPGESGGAGDLDALLSDADLGLDALDDLERKIPEFFAPLMEVEPDSTASRLQPLLNGVPAEEQQRLAAFLDGLTGAARAPGNGSGVILVTQDKLLRECVSAVCGAGFLLATDDAAGVDAIIDHSLSTGRIPLLILDAGEPQSRRDAKEGALPLLQQKRSKYPELAVLLLTCPGDYQLNMRALQAGASAVIPRSSREERPESLVADTIDCARALESYLARPCHPAQGHLLQFKEQFLALSKLQEPPEVTFQLLQAVSRFFDRALTMVLLRSELIAERGIGFSSPGATSSIKLRIPVPDSDLFRQALSGAGYYGDADEALRGTVFRSIGEPASQKVLLLPVQSFGRVIAVIYGDFGERAGGDPRTELLETLALHAGLVIDNALYRKRTAQKQASQ